MLPEVMVCPRCDVEMVEGQVLNNSEEDNVLYSWKKISDGILIPCWKCPKCGQSESVLTD